MAPRKGTPRPPAHPSPKQPSDAPMPPYSPGGVPEPERDEKGNADRTKPSYPPKSTP